MKSNTNTVVVWVWEIHQNADWEVSGADATWPLSAYVGVTGRLLRKCILLKQGVKLRLDWIVSW